MGAENTSREELGSLKLRTCTIQVIGQTALLEAHLELHVPATMDVDVYADYEYAVRKKFEELLGVHGKVLDPVGHEAWMPKETEYEDYFRGQWVHALLAKAEFVLLSKAKKAPKKNEALLIEYLASNPPNIFFDLAKKYGVELGSFAENANA